KPSRSFYVETNQIVEQESPDDELVAAVPKGLPQPLPVPSNLAGESRFDRFNRRVLASAQVAPAAPETAALAFRHSRDAAALHASALDSARSARARDVKTQAAAVAAARPAIRKAVKAMGSV